MTVGLCCFGAFLCGTVFAQDEDANWRLTGADAGQSGSKKGEAILTPENIAANFKLLWKLKLGDPSQEGPSFSEPLLAGRQINAQGFKDIAYWSSADTLYAVDSELGSLVWKKQFNVQSKTRAGMRSLQHEHIDGAADRDQFPRPAGVRQALPDRRTRPWPKP